MPPPIDSVLLIGYGGPEKIDDVRPFIANALKGRPVPPARIEEVVHHYEAIGGASPFNELAHDQATALALDLRKAGRPMPVYVGTRNWTPYLADALRDMAEEGLGHAAGIILAPHQCHSSFEQYQQDVAAAQAAVGPHAPQVSYIDTWFDDPLFVGAVLAQAVYGFGSLTPDDQAAMELIFTAHSIPQPMADASPYVEQLTTSARLVAERFGHEKWSVAYQSRSGRPQDPWLEPDICDVLEARGADGLRHAFVVPIGFVSDHAEVLYDLDIEAAEVAKKVGITMHRARTVQDHHEFIAVLTQRVLALREA